VPTISIRIFSAYGIGLKTTTLLGSLSKNINKNHIEFFGTGDESRDFIYIDDLVYAIDLILHKAEFTGGTINIANGEEVSIKSAVKSFLNFFDKEITYEFNGITRDCDPLNWKADISNLIQLGYKRSFSFEEGLNKYITWLNEKK